MEQITWKRNETNLSGSLKRQNTGVFQKHCVRKKHHRNLWWIKTCKANCQVHKKTIGKFQVKLRNDFTISIETPNEYRIKTSYELLLSKARERKMIQKWCLKRTETSKRGWKYRNKELLWDKKKRLKTTKSTNHLLESKSSCKKHVFKQTLQDVK